MRMKAIFTISMNWKRAIPAGPAISAFLIKTAKTNNLEEYPMKLLSLAEELRSNSYPGRGIVIGTHPETEQRLSPRISSWAEAKTAGTAYL